MIPACGVKLLLCKTLGAAEVGPLEVGAAEVGPLEISVAEVVSRQVLHCDPPVVAVRQPKGVQSVLAVIGKWPVPCFLNLFLRKTFNPHEVGPLKIC